MVAPHALGGGREAPEGARRRRGEAADGCAKGSRAPRRSHPAAGALGTPRSAQSHVANTVCRRLAPTSSCQLVGPRVPLPPAALSPPAGAPPLPGREPNANAPGAELGVSTPSSEWRCITGMSDAALSAPAAARGPLGRGGAPGGDVGALRRMFSGAGERCGSTGYFGGRSHQQVAGTTAGCGSSRLLARLAGGGAPSKAVRLPRARAPHLASPPRQSAAHPPSDKEVQTLYSAAWQLAVAQRGFQAVLAPSRAPPAPSTIACYT